MRYEAVTFDFWNTLVPETRESLDRRRVLWTEVLLSAGHEPSSDEIDKAFEKAWEFFEQCWRSNRQTTVAEVSSHGVAALPFPVSGAVRDDLAAAYLQASEETPRELAPMAVATLEGVRDLGLGIAVICDVGIVPSDRLRRWMDELGILHLIDAHAFSDEIGVYKPHQRMFEHALAELGVADPSRAAHVGDIKRTDIAGARAVGMTSIRYTGVRHDDEEGDDADHVIEHLSAVFEVLDLG